MIRNLENLKGDLANDYKTIPIVYGEMVSKQIITALATLTFTCVCPVEIYDVGYMDIFLFQSDYIEFPFVLCGILTEKDNTFAS
jgi:4-hydroxybenzoate polyprenyltransferase